jgi:hypothetical protein
LVYPSVDGLKYLSCLGMFSDEGIKPRIGVSELVGFVPERQMREGKERRDDPGGLRHDTARR